MTTPQVQAPPTGNGDPAVPENPDATPPEDELKQTPVVYISSVITLLFLVGIYDFLTSSGEPNMCTMTYMFEYPQYVKVKLPTELSEEFPRYNLYVYSEGKLADYLSEGQFEGIPVLFIPGNAGSYKQVRSLASVALRKSIDETKYKTHFDFFALDFGEEMSALYGAVLQDQSNFAVKCVAEILKLYKADLPDGDDPNSTLLPPTSVLIIGHSVGGLIAKSLFVSKDFNGHMVNTIITLATPHNPVFYIDSELHQFYDNVNSYWAANNETTLSHVTMVSIGGGVRDTQVRADLTYHDSANLSLLSTSALDVWVSADHKCIVWCKQLVMAINRVLFNLLNANTGQLTFDKDYRYQVFNHHLVQRSTNKKIIGRNEEVQRPKTINFDKEANWIDPIKRQFVYKRTLDKKWQQAETDVHIMIKTFDDPKHDEVTIDAVNLNLEDWIFGCSASTVYKGTRMCETGDNLSHLTKLLPSKGNRKSIQISLKELRLNNKYTHVVVIVPKNLVEVRVNIDVYSPKERTVETVVPRWISFFMAKQVIVPKTDPKAVSYKISLKGFDQMWQAFTIFVTPVEGKCQSKTHFGLIEFKTSLGLDSTQGLLGHNMTNSMTVRLAYPVHMSKEGNLPEDYSANVSLILNPSCVYQISIRPSMSQMWGQVVRIYYPMIISFVVSVTLMTFAYQLRFIKGEEPEVHSFVKILTSKVSPMSAVMPCRLLAGLLAMASVAPKIPIRTDFALMAESGLDFAMLPIILFFVAIGLVQIVTTAAWLCIHLFSSILVKFSATRERPTEAAGSFSTLPKWPFILSFLLVIIGARLCGSLALCLGTLCQFLHLISMYKNHLVTSTTGSDEDLKESGYRMSQIHFQFSLALLWVLTTLLNAPSLLAWTHYLEYGLFRLEHDPSQITALILCLTLPYLWMGGKRPNLQLDFYNQFSGVVQFFSIVCLLYCSLTTYRLNYAIAATFITTAIHQMVANTKNDREPLNNEQAPQ